MAVMLTGGCYKCGRMCSTGLDSHLLESGNIVDSINIHTPENLKIICYECYDKHYSKSVIRDKKLNTLLNTPWYKKILNRFLYNH
jgi:hypothetical protein